MNRSNSPPPAPLAFRVGVVGHRPNRLGHADLEQLARAAREFLSAIKEEVLAVNEEKPFCYDGGDPVLRAISSLAEGMDRIFAQQALDLGFELCCVMPFAQPEFERDFAKGKALEADSLARFRALLDRAKSQTRLSQFELDGKRNDNGAAYGAAGRVLLNQTDLLLVVWDGQRLGERGGTEETFDEARRTGVPVIWIDAQRPHARQLVHPANPLPKPANGGRLVPDGSASISEVRKWVREVIEVPTSSEAAVSSARSSSSFNAESSGRSLKAFYTEHQPSWTMAVLWKLLRDRVADGQLREPMFAVEPFERQVLDEWPPDTSSPIGRLVDRLRPYYAWPDKLAVLYGDRYRSAFILAFLLAALAVGMALLPVGASFTPHDWPEIACIIAELAAILIILWLVFTGRRQRWHERWIEYRLVAELVRHVRLVAPLGGGRPFPQVPAHWATYGQAGASWMAWYVRAVERALGLPTTVVTQPHLDACLAHLGNVLLRQINYHEANSRICHRIEKRLHNAGMMLLLLTLLCGAIHLAASLFGIFALQGWMPPFLTFSCGFFPALGAALAGIVNQGEFRRIAKRSEAMQRALSLVSDRVAKLRAEIGVSSSSTGRQYSGEAVTLTGDAARLLVNEVLDWRVVFLDQPLKPPA